MRLLQQDPAKRPTGEEVLRQVVGLDVGADPLPPDTTVFVGRAAELAALDKTDKITASTKLNDFLKTIT